MPRVRRWTPILVALLLMLAAGSATASALVLHLAPFARDIDVRGSAAGAFEVALVDVPHTGQRAWRLEAPGLEPGGELTLTYLLEIPVAAEGIALHLDACEGYRLSESAWNLVQLEALLPRPTPYRLRVHLLEGLVAVGGGTPRTLTYLEDATLGGPLARRPAGARHRPRGRAAHDRIGKAELPTMRRSHESS